MKKDFEEQLVEELKSQNASREELEDFSDILLRVSKACDIERSYAHKMSFLENLRKTPKEDNNFFVPLRILAPALSLVVLLFAGVATFASAQKSLPGQPLYGVKRLSENIISAVNPSFKDEILKRRSEEIRTLTEQRKNSGLLKKTISDYKDELGEKGKIDSIKIQETKKNLEDAKDKSGEEDKEEIQKAITQTEDKILKEENKEGKNKKENVEKHGETQIAPELKEGDGGNNNNDGKDGHGGNREEGKEDNKGKGSSSGDGN